MIQETQSLTAGPAWGEILGAIGATVALLLPLCIYVGRLYIKGAVDLAVKRDLEDHKAKISNRLESHRGEIAARLAEQREALQRETQRDIEAIRAEARKLGKEHEVRFTYLHRKTADAIEGTYTRLLQVSDELARFTNIQDPFSIEARKDGFKNVIAAIIELDKFFRPKRIYLAESIEKRVRDFAHKADETARTLQVRLLAQEGRRIPDTTGALEAFNAAHQEAAPIVKELERQFRRLLAEGVLPQNEEKPGDENKAK